MTYEQQIDNFLLGRMTPKEESSFLQECKQNSELKEEAIMMALLVKTIKQTNNMKKKQLLKSFVHFSASIVQLLEYLLRSFLKRIFL